jgi:hypothetical protein|tara:strand:- start:813 stop:1169 length:357 start_codon:yes stop_codon:yes gene_type:complete
LKAARENAMKELFVTGIAIMMWMSAPGLVSAQDSVKPEVAPPAAEASQAEPATQEAAAPDEVEVVENDPDEVICRTRRQTGSNFRERICMTRRQIERSEEAADYALRRMRRSQPFSPN